MPRHVRLLRPSICQGRLTSTPHIDALAKTGLVFERAYVQYSYCAPSRNSFMSGRRPDTSRVWNFGDHFREGAGAEWLSLPQFYKRNGYLTVGAGKLFHPGWPPENDQPSVIMLHSPDFLQQDVGFTLISAFSRGIPANEAKTTTA